MITYSLFRRFSLLCFLAAGLVISVPAKSDSPTLMTITVESGVKALSSRQNTLTVEAGSGKTYVPELVKGQLRLTEKAVQPMKQPERPTDILPDGEITEGTRNIRRVWLASPTTRYGHGVLGDRIEAGSVVAEMANGQIRTLTLNNDAVFEDRFARLADVDGDGADEILLVKSYLDRGAAMTVISPVGPSFKIVAESAAIGLPDRWLNPVGVADFDGDGRNEIAVVITPHIGGTLQLYEMKGNTLDEDISANGFSNHQIGSRNLRLSAIGDFNNDGTQDIVLPDASRRNLLGVTFKGGKFRELFRVPLTGSITTAIYAHDISGDGYPEIIIGLAPDLLVVLSPHL